MVQIIVKICSDGGEGKGECKEWGMIELQGELETRRPVPLSGAVIGDLHFTNKEVPILIVGHHILYGKMVELEKPFALLAKADADNGNHSAMETDQEETTPFYKVVAFVKKKILFNLRPKPIIANVPLKL